LAHDRQEAPEYWEGCKEDSEDEEHDEEWWAEYWAEQKAEKEEWMFEQFKNQQLGL
jgi:hypothetical protein